RDVIERSNHKISLVESFEYDRLDRLVRANVNGNLSGISYEYGMSLVYDAHGNITHKSDIGNYTYDMNRPQLLVRVDVDDYHYDANGNILKGGGREFEWASFNKPTHLRNGESSIRFDYDANHNRYRKRSEVNGETVTTNYFGKLYEKEVQGNKIRHKHHIYADGKLVAVHIKSEEANQSLPDETRYLHYDALGSIDTITDGEGEVVDRIVYDPWGKRLGGDWLVNDPLNSTQLILSRLTTRGFTGHEHIDELNLIHMNGRVYDPQLGRFLSADPTMQFPYSTQGYNRYAYVQNNPLKYTDPSGYGLFSFFKKIFRAVTKVVKKVAKAVVKVAKKVLKPVVRVVKEAVFDVTKKILQSKHGRVIAAIATAAFGGHLVYAATSSAVAAGAAGGFAGGLIGSGGDLKAGVIGGITGGLAGYIGSSAFDSIKGITAKRVVAHGVVGGVASEAQGGKFIHGFVSSGFTKSVSGHIQSLTNSDPLAGGIAAAVVGGTASELAGGKFANGAMTSSFQYLFNQQMSSKDKNNTRQETKVKAKLAKGIVGFGLTFVSKDTLQEFLPDSWQPYIDEVSFIQGVGEMSGASFMYAAGKEIARTGVGSHASVLSVTTFSGGVAVTFSGIAGWSFGSGLNNSYTAISGRSLGADIYHWTH
ncbi:MAG: RHS repeat-associated core domain-containing protein, partial [Sedimenticola sp.]